MDNTNNPVIEADITSKDLNGKKGNDYPCGACNVQVDSDDAGICCENKDCLKWYHAGCANMDLKQYRRLQKAGDEATWYCINCVITREDSAATMDMDSGENETPVRKTQEKKETTAKKNPKKNRPDSILGPGYQKRVAESSKQNRQSGGAYPSFDFLILTELIKDKVSLEVDRKMREYKEDIQRREEMYKVENENLKRKVSALEIEMEIMKKSRLEDVASITDRNGTEQEEVEEEEEVFCFEEVVGDIFKLDKSVALAHCAGADMSLSAGIAYYFKELFGGTDTLRKQKKSIGEVAMLMRDGQRLYYMVTKSKSTDKPHLSDLTKCLEALKLQAISDGVVKLAFPRIGAGIDKLKWEEVRRELNKVFTGSGIQVQVYKRPDTMAVVIGDDSLRVAVNSIQGALVYPDECSKGSSMESMVRLLESAPVTDETQEIVLYLGTCAIKEAMRMTKSEFNIRLGNLLDKAKEAAEIGKNCRVKVVGSLYDWDKSNFIRENINIMMLEACRDRMIKYFNPVNAVWNNVERENGKWTKDDQHVEKHLGRFLSSLLDC